MPDSPAEPAECGRPLRAAAELERRADLDTEFGPIPQQESVAAREWANQVLPASSGARGMTAESLETSLVTADRRLARAPAPRCPVVEVARFVGGTPGPPLQRKRPE
ncbi:MAG TPA: hypothetical protein VIY28_11540 [Pseudonocardiaceae bacterium]